MNVSHGNYPEFLKGLRTMTPEEITGQQLVQAGAIHALKFLLFHGVSEEGVRSMLEDSERNMGLIQEVAGQRGIALEITYEPDPELVPVEREVRS